ncbi:MAG TPA: DUF308 domain-containing protein [Polyangiaceae bacterium]|nr:DUF308 domain-containing protein [Polyangiaceae bacterium]
MIRPAQSFHRFPTKNRRRERRSGRGEGFPHLDVAATEHKLLRVDAYDDDLCRNWKSLAWRVAFGVSFGVVALLWPGMTLSALALLFGLYVLLDGIAACCRNSFRASGG